MCLLGTVGQWPEATPEVAVYQWSMRQQVCKGSRTRSGWHKALVPPSVSWCPPVQQNWAGFSLGTFWQWVQSAALAVASCKWYHVSTTHSSVPWMCAKVSKAAGSFPPVPLPGSVGSCPSSKQMFSVVFSLPRSYYLISVCIAKAFHLINQLIKWFNCLVSLRNITP